MDKVREYVKICVLENERVQLFFRALRYDKYILYKPMSINDIVRDCVHQTINSIIIFRARSLRLKRFLIFKYKRR